MALGNEALLDWNDHMVPVASVISFVRKVKKAISQPVTVADNYNWWALHGTGLAKELDFVSFQTYPVWEGKNIDEAMSFPIANLQTVRNALPQSRFVITESGWAPVASEFGPRANEAKQKSRPGPGAAGEVTIASFPDNGSTNHYRIYRVIELR